MKFASGLLILAAYMPYAVWADAAAAAAAAAAASSGRGTTAAAAAASAASNGGTASATATAESSSIAHLINCDYCPQDYNPVCGSDRNTYSNKCWLACISEEYERNGYGPIGLQHWGVCQPAPCVCPQVVDPVCGTNNHTYSNICYLNCENDVRKNYGLDPIGVLMQGVCKKPTCVCPKAIIPVCGSNGKTYRNICIMECYSRANQAKGLDPIDFKYKGACKKEVCSCPLIKRELCASDKKTYYNECALECENWRRSQLGQTLLENLYRGKCAVDCRCPVNIAPAPVCANNDVTFPNVCQFNCENDRLRASDLPLLFMRWKGQCDCSCNKAWKPVCASDNNTYQNKCVLDCQNFKRVQDGFKKLDFKGDGVCYQCDCNYCGIEYKPVCGSDNRTYWNEQWLNCNIACRWKAGLPSLWKVRDGKC